MTKYEIYINLLCYFKNIMKGLKNADEQYSFIHNLQRDNHIGNMGKLVIELSILHGENIRDIEPLFDKTSDILHVEAERYIQPPPYKGIPEVEGLDTFDECGGWGNHPKRYVWSCEDHTKTGVDESFVALTPCIFYY